MDVRTFCGGRNSEGDIINRMKILVFTEGTATLPAAVKDLSREEKVRLNLANDPLFHNFADYIPANNVVDKLKGWKSQGATIYYLTSRTSPEEITIVRKALETYGFPDSGNLLFRQNGQDYKDVAEKLMPEIFIEDDCESIGGDKEMTSTHFSLEAKEKIKTIVIKEFEGIDHLPDNLDQLQRF